MLDAIAAIHWTDPSTSMSFTRIFTQQEDNKIYEFCWDSDSDKWTRGNDGYSITSVMRPNTNIVAFKAEANKIILGCIGQDGSLWLKKFNADDSGGGKIIYDFFRMTSTEFRPEKLASDPPEPKFTSVCADTSLATVDMSADGQLHWRLFNQAYDNTIQQVDYCDNTWNTATTILTNAMPLTPLAAIYSITPPGRTDLLPVLFLVYKENTRGLTYQVPYLAGNFVEQSGMTWPIGGEHTLLKLGATITGNAWPPPPGKEGFLDFHIPEASSKILVRAWSSWTDLRNSPSLGGEYMTGMSVDPNKPLASVKIGMNLMIYTSSYSGKVIGGFFWDRLNWTEMPIDPIEWDTLTTRRCQK
ncbi:hypothetical protein GGX14DRAFT_569907 [Mycena pura]|uniref:Fucose-specific lectin n=1 Tax=Mycena pura TaxID=153505 RepID=A0AAD6VA35_9AGAR|nr:hypothetical protein GGX14DRAFT_569907 [Mycena pura]